MKITSKDFKKYIIFSLLFLWLIIFSHLFYMYIKSNSIEKPIKWWVLLEWVINEPINPLPYIWNNYYSKYVQSLLYRGCLKDTLEQDLCSISTKDDKTFYVSLIWDNKWSDWTKIILDDVYFTYNDIIKNNTFNLKNIQNKSIKNIKKEWDKIIITFNKASVNNINFFKNYILPKKILKDATKGYYVHNYLKNFINSTCVKIDLKSDFIDNLVLDYNKCSSYFIKKYQFLLKNNVSDIKNLSWMKIDIYNWYENIDKEQFSWYRINQNLRYAMFWNVKKSFSYTIKTYISNNLLDWLKKDIWLKNKIQFNGYGLLKLDDNLKKITKEQFKELLSKNILLEKKEQFKNNILNIKDNYNYIQWKTNTAFIKNIKNNFLVINGILLTWWYDKIWISYKTWNEYILKSYKWDNKFKYIISERFKNIKNWENKYKIFWYKKDEKKLIDTITIFYKKIIYPKFSISYPSFTLVYLNKWLILNIWQKISNILKEIYPWKIIEKSVWEKEYKDILKSWDYNLVVSSVNFNWKDISNLFLSNNPIINPSNFINQNFASLINQDLLAEKDLKKKIYTSLNKIYQQNIPIVFIWNKIVNLYVNKKYNIDNNLDYSYFENRKKMIKKIVITKMKKSDIQLISLKWFILYLKKYLK